MSPDYYAILGVKHGATKDQIKAAWKAASLKHHPDRNGGRHSNEFLRVTAAYEWFEKND